MATNPDRELQLHKKTFNCVAIAFFKQLGKIFASDPKLVFLKDELDRLSKDKKMNHVPAMQYFQAMNIFTGVHSATTDGDAVVGELILNRDARLFSNECKATINQLEAVDFKYKWHQLTDKNKIYVWEYLARLAQLSAKVAAGMAIDMGDVMNLFTAVNEAAIKADTITNDKERMAALISDPGVAAVAKDISEKMNKK